MNDIPERAVAAERTIKQITLLMPVWGHQFISRFLEFCLPTLLAPNNIPAIAQALPCRFIILSSAADEAILRSHPAWQKLDRHCAVEIWPIDDLITQGNHTATITLAFERALRRSGNAMLETCFIFLMSDYLVADGSLKTVLRTVQNGASAVLAGNFQIIAEAAGPLLRHKIDLGSHAIIFPPRDLVRWSLGHLHPATAANIVNFGLTHNAHTNRLFWRIDENSMIGRFYLMHPIAIHPQVTDFAVSASWDYSFLPELCPSGTVVTLTDSDDYLVVELQRREYEWENLRPGPTVPAALARSLAEWTTDAHRRNVAQTVLFHAADRPAGLAHVVAQSDAFIESVRQAFSAPPLHHRQHPYWVGSIAVNRHRGHRPLSKEDWSFLLSNKEDQSSASLQRARAILVGHPPAVTRLHPLWPDYELPLKVLNDVLAANGRVLLVAQDTEAFAPWVVRTPGDVLTLNAGHLLQLTRAPYDELAGTFDACLLLADEAMLEQADQLIAHIGPLLKAKGRIILMITNSLSAEDPTEFGRDFAAQAGRLLNRSVWLEDCQYVELSPSRLATRNALMRTMSMSGAMRLLAPAALPMALANYFANISARIGRMPPHHACSSVCVTLRASEQPAPYPLRFGREAALDRTGLASPIHADDLPTPVGLPTPELQARRLWQDEPAQLAAHLARYRFVAAVIGDRHDVAEYGCVSPSGTRLVLPQVRRLTLFDPRTFVVDDLQRRFQNNPRFETRLHDILSAPLSRQVDSVYCVDFIQHISRDEEDIFVRHLRDSLGHDFDFLLIGSPSYGAHGARVGTPPAARDAAGTDPPNLATAQLNRQDFPRQSLEQQSGLADGSLPAGGPAGDPGLAPGDARVYRRSGEELKALMTHFFHTVFIFSMIDDIAMPGIDPNAQYIFGLACGKQP